MKAFVAKLEKYESMSTKQGCPGKTKSWDKTSKFIIRQILF